MNCSNVVGEVYVERLTQPVHMHTSLVEIGQVFRKTPNYRSMNVYLSVRELRLHLFGVKIFS